MGPKVQGRIWWHLLLGSAAKGAGSTGLPLRCAWPLRARTWRPPERVPARLQGHNGQAIQRPRACAARAAPIIAGVACRAQVLAGRCRIHVAVLTWWRRTRTGKGSMSPSYEGDVGCSAGQQRRAETQWFAVIDGMSSGPWDKHGNSQWSTVLPSARTTLTDAHYVCGQYRTPRGRNRQHGRLPRCISAADPETRRAYMAQRGQLTRAAALSVAPTAPGGPI
jgi:hypothetical protein